MPGVAAGASTAIAAADNASARALTAHLDKYLFMTELLD
jgi:hypothetical protein